MRGLTSSRRVTGPVGSRSWWKRSALRKKNSLSLMMGPPSWVVKSVRLRVDAGSPREGFSVEIALEMFLEPRLFFV